MSNPSTAFAAAPTMAGIAVFNATSSAHAQAPPPSPAVTKVSSKRRQIMIVPLGRAVCRTPNS